MRESNTGEQREKVYGPGFKVHGKTFYYEPDTLKKRRFLYLPLPLRGEALSLLPLPSRGEVR
jgi:hypothetical protein